MVKCWIKSCLLMCSGNPHRNSLQGNVTDLQSFSTQVPSSHPSVSDTENARRGPRHAPQTAGSVVTRRLDSFSREVTQRCVVAGQRPVPRSESPPPPSGPGCSQLENLHIWCQFLHFHPQNITTTECFFSPDLEKVKLPNRL